MQIEGTWLQQPAVTKLFSVIRAAGGEVRFVGGCVRDAVLGRAIGDFDLATTLVPEAVVQACEAAGFKVVPTGLKHGTVTVICASVVFEVTTLRRDVRTDGRHAEVVYTDNWQEDAARRDFTMNALFCDASGEVTDFFGGVEDAKAGRVRFVGDPETRIREDVLRILRFFRFFACYGQGEPDEAGLSACCALVPLLPHLSTERVRTELLKTLVAADPVPVWRLMVEIGVFETLKLPLTNLERLAGAVAFEKACGQTDPLRRLWAVWTEAGAIGAALKLSNAEAARIKALCPLPQTDTPFRLAYERGVQLAVDALILSGKAEASQLKELQNWSRPVFPLNGKDAVTLGFSPDAAMGKALKAVEAWWVKADFAPSREACLAELARQPRT